MLRNYLLIVLRNLLRYKVYSAVNVPGLAIGMAACLLMLLFVNHEWSFDGMHRKNGYRLDEVQQFEGMPALYTTELRVKEIGIRKVMGAPVGSVVALLSRDFLKLAVIAFLLASPLAWRALKRWLDNFAYRIGMAWRVFAPAGILALLIAWVTVSFQRIKAALADPVKSLRSE